MDLKLRGRRALITGASKGIGLAIAEVLAAEGCHLVLVSRTATDLEAARQKLGPSAQTITHALDVSNSASIDELAAKHPDIDILVNNAGAIPAGRIHEIDEKRWREAWDLKVFGYINMTRRLYALMAGRKAGVIINILGAAGENPDFDYIAGSSGNASLMAFTRAIGGTAPRDGIRVVGVNPGPVMTERLITLNRHRAEQRLGDPEQSICHAPRGIGERRRRRATRLERVQQVEQDWQLAAISHLLAHGVDRLGALAVAREDAGIGLDDPDRGRTIARHRLAERRHGGIEPAAEIEHHGLVIAVQGPQRFALAEPCQRILGQAAQPRRVQRLPMPTLPHASSRTAAGTGQPPNSPYASPLPARVHVQSTG